MPNLEEAVAILRVPDLLPCLGATYSYWTQIPLRPELPSHMTPPAPAGQCVASLSHQTSWCLVGGSKSHTLLLVSHHKDLSAMTSIKGMFVHQPFEFTKNRNMNAMAKLSVATAITRPSSEWLRAWLTSYSVAKLVIKAQQFLSHSLTLLGVWSSHRNLVLGDEMEADIILLQGLMHYLASITRPTGQLDNDAGHSRPPPARNTPLSTCLPNILSERFIM